MERDAIERALETLGILLEERAIGYEIVVVGGSALLLLGLIRRPTKDLDVLALVRQGIYVSAEPFPEDLQQAVLDVAAELGLASDWLNAGPTAQIKSGLPEGFEARLETLSFRTLVVHVASRLDQVYLKLFAAVDHWPSRSKHIDDLRRLDPSLQELRDAARWVRGQDDGPEFPDLVAAVLEYLGVVDADA